MRDVWNDAVIAEIADLMVYQSIRLPHQPSAKILAGVDYVMIAPRYAGLSPDVNGHIVVSLGGSDPHGLTPKVLEALKAWAGNVIVIKGPGMTDDYPGWQTVDAPESLLTYLDGAALLVGALGMTAYEAAAAGVPSLLVAWSDDHEATALEFEAHGAAVSLGRWDKFDPKMVTDLTEQLLTQPALWHRFSTNARALVDGCGVQRVADRLLEVLR